MGISNNDKSQIVQDFGEDKLYNIRHTIRKRALKSNLKKKKKNIGDGENGKN